jgi:hypothetical protein
VEENKKEIFAALIAFQAGVEPIAKTADNPFFKSKYADLTGIMESIRGPLAACGLGVTYSSATNGKSVTVVTTLIHRSGESISTPITADAKDSGPQSIGSALTYLRRYGISLLLGLVTEDDDGEAATHHHAEQPKAAPKPAPVKVAFLVDDEATAEAKRAMLAELMAAVGENADRKNTIKSQVQKYKAARFLDLSLDNCVAVYNLCMKVFTPSDKPESGQ